MIAARKQQLKPRSRKLIRKELASSNPPTVRQSHLLDLPPELRNYIYEFVFPPGSVFETTQLASRQWRRKLDHLVAKDPPLRHPVVINGVQVKYLLGILGTCKTTRQEASCFLRQNLTGTFKIEPPTTFWCIPTIILEVIDTITFSPYIESPTKLRYTGQFPNLENRLAGLKRVVVDTCVASKHHDFKRWIYGLPDADEATCKSLIKTYFGNLTTRDLMSRGRAELEIALSRAKKNTPEKWQLFSGECPFSIIVQMYVLDGRVKCFDGPQGGYLINLDYNHGRVESIEEKGFVRLPNDEIPNTADRYWFSCSAWKVLEQE